VKKICLGLGLLVCVGCGGSSGSKTDARPDGAVGSMDSTVPGGDARPAEAGADSTPVSAGPLTWAGVYDSQGLWDLSGPITARRTLGDVVADLMVEQIVSLAGVPSLLEDKASDVVRDLIGAKVKALVDTSAPAPLRPDSELMKKLAVVLASTEVTSTIELIAPSRDVVRGTEEVRSFTYGFEGRRKVLAAGDLLARTVPIVTIGADWKGKVSNGALVVEQHDYAIRFGKMLLWVVDNVLEEQGAASLSQAAASALDCIAITAVLLDGQSKFTFGVGLAAFAVGGDKIKDGCQAAGGMVRDKALGLFDLDTGVQLGGEVQPLDADGDRIAERLQSRPGYGGILAVVRASLAPRVTARFEALRRAHPRAAAGLGPNYADMSNVIGTTERLPVRGRVFVVPGGFDPTTTTPFAQLSQQELPQEAVTVTAGGMTLGSVTTNGEGYLDGVLDIATLKLLPGNHRLEFLVRGKVAGTASARLLAPGAPAVVVRSDVDLTYLDTDFMSTTGKLALLVQRAAERAGLPAMEVAYRFLRRGATSVEDLPLTFLSGSPTFFKMVLEEKARLDQIFEDGVVLKPFKDIIAAKVTDVDLAGVVPALEEQVGYKLTALLRLRLEVPRQTQEILLGDDSEADAVAYSLYHQLTSGQIGVDALLARIDAIPVDATWRAQVAELAPKVVAVLPPAAPVVAIYINRTGKPNPRFPVADWTVPQLTRYHSGAWPLALDLFEEGRMSGPGVMAVKARLKELGRSTADLSAAAQAGVSAGFLRAETVTVF
jgi:hypothetical protein